MTTINHMMRHVPFHSRRDTKVSFDLDIMLNISINHLQTTPQAMAHKRQQTAHCAKHLYYVRLSKQTAKRPTLTVIHIFRPVPPKKHFHCQSVQHKRWDLSSSNNSRRLMRPIFFPLKPEKSDTSGNETVGGDRSHMDGNCEQIIKVYLQADSEL